MQSKQEYMLIRMPNLEGFTLPTYFTFEGGIIQWNLVNNMHYVYNHVLYFSYLYTFLAKDKKLYEVVSWKYDITNVKLIKTFKEIKLKDIPQVQLLEPVKLEKISGTIKIQNQFPLH